MQWRDERDRLSHFCMRWSEIASGSGGKRQATEIARRKVVLQE
jgi:hypothetical protein